MIPNTAEEHRAAHRESSRRDWRAVAGTWGQPGNALLVASVGLFLFVPLAVEALTTLDLSTYLPLHMFLGFLLLPPLALKLAATSWRALRYYTGSRTYRLAGPPRLLLRMLAPLLVASTLALFGSGVALIVRGHGRGWLQTLHAASFLVWGILMIVHLVAYLARALRVGTTDWGRRREQVVAGASSRRAALVGALLVGVIVAVVTYPAQQAFRPHHQSNGTPRVSPSRT